MGGGGDDPEVIQNLRLTLKTKLRKDVINITQHRTVYIYIYTHTHIYIQGVPGEM